MLIYHLKIGWRKLAQQKLIHLLQIGGLGIGLAGFLLIAQFVFFEKSFDRANPLHERLCRINANIFREGKLHLRSSITYLALSESLQTDFPDEIEAFTRLVTMTGQVRVGDQSFVEKNLIYCDAVFPQLFNLKMTSGDGATALAEPGAAILTKTAALQIFGTADCLGREFDFNCQFPQKKYAVRGVCEDLPANSHLQNRIFLSLKSLTQTPGVLEPWAWRDFPNYILLKKGVDVEQFSKKIGQTDYVGAHFPRYPERFIRHELFLQKISDIHLAAPRLESEFALVGDARTLANLSWLGGFLLLISVVNFVLLALAKSAERAREIGIRKTIGAGKLGLLLQFFAENLPNFSIAIALAGGLVWAAQPFFRNLVEQNLTFEWLANPVLLAGVAAFLGFIFLLGNFVPAWAMTRFSPVNLIKTGKKEQSSSGRWAHQSLIIVQFGVAVFMLVATLTIWRQIDFLLHRDIGLDIEQTLVLNFPNDRSPETAQKVATLKKELAQLPNIRSATASMSVPGDGGPWVPSIRKLAADGSTTASRVISLNSVDSDFIPAFDLKILAGRNFRQENFPERGSIIFTEIAARTMGFEKPEAALGQKFICAGDTVSVIGVVSAYTESGGQRLPGDFMFIQRTDEMARISIKFEATEAQSVLAAVEKTWHSVFQKDVFEYVFLDEHFAQQYAAEVRFGKIAGIFSGLAVVIACMGLLGIALLSMARRVREIGIRKVLGASVVNISNLLIQDFLKLVAVAVLLASPLAWYFMKNWLSDFAYHINMEWWMFAAAGAVAMAIAFLTVGFQSVRAALANPVQSLRSE